MQVAMESKSYFCQKTNIIITSLEQLAIRKN